MHSEFVQERHDGIARARFQFKSDDSKCCSNAHARIAHTMCTVRSIHNMPYACNARTELLQNRLQI